MKKNLALLTTTLLMACAPKTVATVQPSTAQPSEPTIEQVEKKVETVEQPQYVQLENGYIVEQQEVADSLFGIVENCNGTLEYKTLLSGGAVVLDSTYDVHAYTTEKGCVVESTWTHMELGYTLETVQALSTQLTEQGVPENLHEDLINTNLQEMNMALVQELGYMLNATTQCTFDSVSDAVDLYKTNMTLPVLCEPDGSICYVPATKGKMECSFESFPDAAWKVVQ